jgi:hypothetical protein
MNAVKEAPIKWMEGNFSRIPYSVYTDTQLHQRELDDLKGNLLGLRHGGMGRQRRC